MLCFKFMVWLHKCVLFRFLGGSRTNGRPREGGVGGRKRRTCKTNKQKLKLTCFCWCTFRHTVHVHFWPHPYFMPKGSMNLNKGEAECCWEVLPPTPSLQAPSRFQPSWVPLTLSPLTQFFSPSAEAKASIVFFWRSHSAVKWCQGWMLTTVASVTSGLWMTLLCFPLWLLFLSALGKFRNRGILKTCNNPQTLPSHSLKRERFFLTWKVFFSHLKKKSYYLLLSYLIILKN